MEPREILVVDDSQDDIHVVRRAIAKRWLDVYLHEVYDGESALAFLRQQPPYESAPRPDLILLDINMPGRDGQSTLAEIKSDSAIRDIPVIMMSMNWDDTIVTECYQKGCNCYVAKPETPAEAEKLIDQVQDYWFRIALLPAHHKNGRASMQRR